MCATVSRESPQPARRCSQPGLDEEARSRRWTRRVKTAREHGRDSRLFSSSTLRRPARSRSRSSSPPVAGRAGSRYPRERPPSRLRRRTRTRPRRRRRRRRKHGATRSRLHTCSWPDAQPPTCYSRARSPAGAHREPTLLRHAPAAAAPPPSPAHGHAPIQHADAPSCHGLAAPAEPTGSLSAAPYGARSSFAAALGRAVSAAMSLGEAAKRRRLDGPAVRAAEGDRPGTQQGFRMCYCDVNTRQPCVIASGRCSALRRVKSR